MSETPRTNSVAAVGLEFYKLFARVLPMYLTLLPAGLAAQVWIGGNSIATGAITLLGGPLCLAFLLAEFGRDAGYRKQERLWELWGGPPTTQLLRHRNGAVNPVVRTRVHKKLHKLMPDITLPTREEEAADPTAADHVYEACVQHLIGRTRDRARFRLLYKENVSYGFRRNLWALKPLGLVLCGLSFVTSIAFILREWPTPAPNAAVAAVSSVVLAGVWLIRIRSSWIRIPADAYATRLLETCDELTKA